MLTINEIENFIKIFVNYQSLFDYEHNAESKYSLIVEGSTDKNYISGVLNNSLYVENISGLLKILGIKNENSKMCMIEIAKSDSIKENNICFLVDRDYDLKDEGTFYSLSDNVLITDSCDLETTRMNSNYNLFKKAALDKIESNNPIFNELKSENSSFEKNLFKAINKSVRINRFRTAYKKMNMYIKPLYDLFFKNSLNGDVAKINDLFEDCSLNCIKVISYVTNLSNSIEFSDIEEISKAVEYANETVDLFYDNKKEKNEYCNNIRAHDLFNLMKINIENLYFRTIFDGFEEYYSKTYIDKADFLKTNIGVALLDLESKA